MLAVPNSSRIHSLSLQLRMTGHTLRESRRERRRQVTTMMMMMMMRQVMPRQRRSPWLWPQRKLHRRTQLLRLQGRADRASAVWALCCTDGLMLGMEVGRFYAIPCCGNIVLIYRIDGRSAIIRTAAWARSLSCACAEHLVSALHYGAHKS